MVKQKRKYSIEDKVCYSVAMRRHKITKYKHIGLFRKVVGYVCVGYGVVGVDFGLSVIVGCLLLGIPLERLNKINKMVCGRLWYGVRVLFSKRRLVYEYNCLKMRLFG